MHFIDIRRARSCLDGYNNEDDVADSENREIVEILMDPNVMHMLQVCDRPSNLCPNCDNEGTMG